jgi:hypothetical protein
MKTESNLAFIILVEEEFYKRKFTKYVLIVLTAVCIISANCSTHY